NGAEIQANTFFFKLASEIAESKQPYKEIEALINKSRLVLRTQKLAPVKDRDKEKEKEKDTNTKNKILGNFTDKPVRLLLTEVKNDGNKVARSKTKSPKIDESIKNTNAYLLRIKKTESRNENIDLQLKIPSVG
ncbi:uncharacterized protein LOC123272274, partial [Cotesia glomerata]|uniref:uncharacterized protein LOC123272274 n=1 Tax=Cotesia glomerata TaxID=32391 RepID=UPI001D02A501